MKKQVLILLVMLSVCAITANAAMVHRYDFQTAGQANDIVGTANGTLGTGAISGGVLTTDGTTTGVSLPTTAVAGISGSFTIETWFFAIAPQGAFHTAFSFSDGTTANYVIGTPARDQWANWDSSIGVIGGGGGAVGEQLLRGYPFDVWWDNPNQGPRQMLLTYDGTTLAYYQDGVIAPWANNLTDVGLNLSSLSAQIGINSGSPWPDPSLWGYTTDFRIYNQSLTANQVAGIFALGADASNADISAIPEPATMMLLGLGALGLLKRRS